MTNTANIYIKNTITEFRVTSTPFNISKIFRTDSYQTSKLSHHRKNLSGMYLPLRLSKCKTHRIIL